MAKKGRLVYSTDVGRICPTCQRSTEGCTCRGGSSKRDSGAAPNVPPSDGVVRVGRATQGKKGKGVTTISGVPLQAAELTRFAKELKKKCGSGGRVQDGVIEIQGDHRDVLIPLLEARGWTVRRSGG